MDDLPLFRRETLPDVEGASWQPWGADKAVHIESGVAQLSCIEVHFKPQWHLLFFRNI